MAVSPSTAGSGSAPEFDQFADNYDAALNKGISVSGEDKHYFIAGRVEHTARCVKALGVSCQTVMDFGCGTGTSIPVLREKLGAVKFVGIDVSEAELAIARKDFGGEGVSFLTPGQYTPAASVDVAYSNGTFHHIPPAQRAGVVEFVFKSLRPGGVFALWENNPWNPGTRIVMKRIPFDRDAITLSPPETKRMLVSAGFRHVRSDFLFYFPRMLSVLRATEGLFRKLPLGAQYLTLGQKPV